MSRLNKATYSFLFILLAGALLIFSSCDANNINKPNITYSYIYQKNAAIKVDTTRISIENHDTTAAVRFSVQPGNDRVFIYKKYNSSSDKTSGARAVNELAFQISPKTKRFSYHNRQLQQIQALYQQFCYCEEKSTAVKVTTGIIRGEILSPVHWIIKVDVTIEDSAGTTVHLKFHEPFYSKKLL